MPDANIPISFLLSLTPEQRERRKAFLAGHIAKYGDIGGRTVVMPDGRVLTPSAFEEVRRETALGWASALR